MSIPLAKHVVEMKRMGNQLVPFTYPVANFEIEENIIVLKQRIFIIDGYEVSVTYSKADYHGEYYLESLQIQSVYALFLPFVIICKLGRAFFGSENLSYIEFFKTNRKVYCWALKLKDGCSLPPDKTTKIGNYEGFEFHILQEGQMDLL